MPLLEFTDRGIYCAKGKFYIDPWKPVDDAVITHAHSDHAYVGHKRYLAHHLSREVLYYRLGEITLQTVEYGEKVMKNGVEITLFPAGHVIGSAQIRVESQGEVWVVSGDYKTEDDGVCTPFEPVDCQHFISECTFGMPVYQWKPQAQLFDDMNNWWRQNAAQGIATVVVGYSLGKAQRILQNLDLSIGKVYTHGVIENTNEALRRNGIVLNPTERITQLTPKDEIKKGIVIAPPSSVGTPWMRKFQPYRFGYCSGWMALRGAKRRRAADRGFILSDHADWNGLISAIDATGCEKVYLTHGYTASFTRYLNDIGFDAHEVHTLYGGEEENSFNIPEEEALKAVESPTKVLSAGEDLGEAHSSTATRKKNATKVLSPKEDLGQASSSEETQNKNATKVLSPKEDLGQASSSTATRKKNATKVLSPKEDLGQASSSEETQNKNATKVLSSGEDLGEASSTKATQNKSATKVLPTGEGLGGVL